MRPFDMSTCPLAHAGRCVQAMELAKSRALGLLVGLLEEGCAPAEHRYAAMGCLQARQQPGGTARGCWLQPWPPGQGQAHPCGPRRAEPSACTVGRDAVSVCWVALKGGNSKVHNLHGHVVV
jgi:hypothetical protein